MSRGREARHTAMVLACVALMAVLAGCRRSPFQRLADGTAPESSPAAAQSEIPQLLPVPENRSGTVAAPVPPEKGPGTEPMTAPVAPAPTPLLDAALKHAEAVEQTHRQAIAARELPSSSAVASQPDMPCKVMAAGTRTSAQDDKEPVRTFKLSGQAPVATPPGARAMADAGADGIVVETMSDVEEAKLAVAAAREAGLPVVACMTFDSGAKKDRTMMGASPEQAAEQLTAAGADVIGSNCGRGIAGMVEICRRLRAATDRPVWIKANAGLPEMVDGTAIYRQTPEEFAAYVPQLVDAGATFLGGCCGTTPEFIRAVAARLRKE